MHRYAVFYHERRRFVSIHDNLQNKFFLLLIGASPFIVEGNANVAVHFVDTNGVNILGHAGAAKNKH